MKKVINAFVTLIMLCAFGYWIHLLDSSISRAFQETYISFGMSIPSLTSFIISTLPYWPYVVSIVGALSFATLFSKGKFQYLGAFLPLFVGLFYLCAFYAPIISHGAVI